MHLFVVRASINEHFDVFGTCTGGHVMPFIFASSQ